MLVKLEEPGGDRSLVIEDDDRVAYAYLLRGRQVIADVWLYNVIEAPDAVDWRDKTQLPFLNPKSLCLPATERICDAASVACVWSTGGVDVLVKGQQLARLENGVKPGWSSYARKPGPLAKPLVLE